MDGSPFETLPPEVRNAIWELVVAASTEIHPIKRYLHDGGTVNDITYVKTEQPAITKACRQIREESLGLYYFINAFTHVLPVQGFIPELPQLGSELGYFTRWMESIGPQNAQALRTIKFELHGDHCDWIDDDWEMGKSPDCDGWERMFETLGALGCSPDRLNVSLELKNECRSSETSTKEKHASETAWQQRRASMYVAMVKKLYLRGYDITTPGKTA